MGTGFFISEEYLVTNASVVGTSRNLKIVVNNNDFNAYVVAVHYFLDLALLKVDDYISFRYLTFERYDREMSDTRGTILNYPNDDRLLQTTGTILTNAVIQDNHAIFQIDASLPSGRVGGPVLNSQNHIIGFMMSNDFNRDLIDNIHFIPTGVHLAIKSDYIMTIAQIYTNISVHVRTPEGDFAMLTGNPGLTASNTPSGKPPTDTLTLIAAPYSNSSTARIDTQRPNDPREPNDVSDHLIESSIIQVPIDPSVSERAANHRAELERVARENALNERTRAQEERERQQRLQLQQERDRLDRDRVEREQAELTKINNERREREQRERVQREQQQTAERERVQREQQQAVEREREQRAIERERVQREQIQAAEKEKPEPEPATIREQSVPRSNNRN
jgi:hypothetical protein